MARRARSLDVSLFPFLSILACMIGALTLLLAGLVVGEMIDPGEARRIAFAELVEENRRSELRIREARDRDRQAQDLAQLQLRWEREKPAAEDRAREIADHSKEIERLKREASRLESELGEPRAERDRLRTQVDERERHERELRGRYLLRPQGGGRTHAPVFVECKRSGLVLRPDAPAAERRVVSRARIRTDATYRKLLDDAGQDEDAIVVYLIRKGGVVAFDSALMAAIERKVRHGYLPIPGDRPLDFRLFRPPDLGIRTRTAPGGQLVLEVAPESPAAGAGLRPGDVIFSIAGASVATSRDLRKALRGRAPGEEIEIAWTRDGRRQTGRVRIEEPE